ncbi:MFS transporter [Sciscionella sediminilitoris]|uniref:MFS transporter n=1 Tax=Sciscionella sediminilitoris TaxID=1445613 RepID=UPI0006893EE6|nr:MFS transporter [Sciscionella sp. SE31]
MNWLHDWDPEDRAFWERTGKRIANRNLWCSVFVEHIGFSVWTLWSVFVLFLGPEYGLSAGDKFLLVSLSSLVGALLRIPYSLAVARFGGRNWTVVSAASLLIPTVFAALVLHPGTPLWVFALLAAAGGLGGGNFASAMANINSFYPERAKGWALGIGAGGGNLGVAVIQLLALGVLAIAGTAADPRLLLWIYIPLIVLATGLAVTRMDNIARVRAEGNAMREVLRHGHTYLISLLYIGTFGSFIGYSFAFGLVLSSQFQQSAVQAATVTFLGPLLGSLSRPLGGRLADRFGGAVISFGCFTLLAAATVLVLAASGTGSLGAYVCGFILLFVLSGIGNGSVYKMIPAIHASAADRAIGAGAPVAASLATARRHANALIGIAAAVGALGGVFINLAFRASFSATGSGDPACYGFLGCYLLCALLTWAVYLRGSVTRTQPRRSGADKSALHADPEALEVH